MMDAFGLAQDAFFFEAQAFGDGTAFFVFERAMDLDPVEFEFGEAIGHHRPAGPRHDALALVPLAEPVPDLAKAVFCVDPMIADHPGKDAAVPDAHMNGLAEDKLFQRFADEGFGVGHVPVMINPG